MIIKEISEKIVSGKVHDIAELVPRAIADGHSAKEILDDGLLAGMSVIGEKFKNNEVYLPEVMLAAKAMGTGSELLRPYLTAADAEPVGTVCIGTVLGDRHDIGKNLVKMMLEGKGITVIDLGTNVSPVQFVKAAVTHNCSIILCSALLTTTMKVMGDVVSECITAGIRDKVKIMVGGAPVTEEFCVSIGADAYNADAASAADTAYKFLKGGN